MVCWRSRHGLAAAVRAGAVAATRCRARRCGCSTSTCPPLARLPRFGVTALGSASTLPQDRSLAWAAWPVPRPRSACCTPVSPWSPARSGAASPGASTGRGTPASPRPPPVRAVPRYLALRRLPHHEQRAKRCAIAGLIAVIDVPLVYGSVEWWRTLHQEATVRRSATSNQRLHAVQPVRRGVAFTLVYLWLMVHKTRIAAWRTPRRHASTRLEERRAEAALEEVAP